MEKISLAIPVHDVEKRHYFIRQNIDVANDERISEVVVSVEPQSNIVPLLDRLRGHGKVRVFVNDVREYVFRNKYRAIERCTNDWVVILDSDNLIDVFYLNVLYKLCPWNRKWVYQPEYLFPMFDARRLGGDTVDRGSVARYMNIPIFRCILNGMNYLVNRTEFLAANKELFDSGFDPKCADSLYINYNMMKAGCAMHVVKNLQYTHTVHAGSFYKQNMHQYKHLVVEIEDRFRNLKP